MSAEHYAEVDLTDPDWPTVRFVCTGDDADVCRQWCAEGCEEKCLGDDIVLWPELTAGEEAPDGIHRWEPTPAIGGSSCREMDWLGAVGWEDSGWTEDDDQITAAQLRPGRHRIETEWTGDDYIWRYPAEVPA